MTMPAAVSAGRPTQSMLGALALMLASAALAPVFTSGRWVLPVAGTMVAVIVVGVALRALRAPAVLVVLGQVLALAVVLTVAFTQSAVLGVLPGPAAVEQLRSLLDGAGAQIASEKTPVAVTQELLLLVVASLGCAAIVVDALVAGVQIPAVAGLVLLGVVAVPASLSHTLLPWWSFVLGAVAVLLLLVSNSSRRTATAGPASGAAGLRSPGVVVVIAAALACALGVGSAVTGVGTAGRLPDSGSGSGGVALNPFTQLRGELSGRTATPLFTVAGMTQPTYLRTITLDRFVNNQGWIVENMAAGDTPGAAMGKQQLAGSAQTVTVRGLRYSDRWLPTPGIPTAVRGVDSPLRGYTYNAEEGVLQTAKRQPLPAYTVDAVNPGGGPAQLRALGRTPQSQAGADPRWRQLDGVDPRVGQLAQTIVGQSPTTFDVAVALSTYFTNPGNGFTYQLSSGTGGTGGDALVDFLTVSKQGFCEQYASAMAVMLRGLGIASRVVLGYTPGTGGTALRTVTTDDAHAWVEVYFAGVGWVTFDPTPLTGARGITPGYVAQAAATPATPQAGPTQAGPASAASPPTQPPAGAPPTGPNSLDAQRTPPTAQPLRPSAGPSTPLLVGALGALLLVLVACWPAALRRRRLVRRLGAGTPDAAWAELTDLSRDRGVDIPGTETPRTTAVRLCAVHGLDEDARAAVFGVIDAVEQQWYGGTAGAAEPTHRREIEEMVAAWRRCAPLTKQQHVFPRSVLVAGSARTPQSAETLAQH